MYLPSDGILPFQKASEKQSVINLLVHELLVEIRANRVVDEAFLPATPRAVLGLC